MTDNELLSFLSKNTGHICGRFDTEQLQRPLIETQLQPRKNWKYWLASVSALFLLGNKSSAQVTEQHLFNNSITQSIKGDTVPKTEPTTMGKVISERLLEGVVTDTSNVPIQNVLIQIKDLKLCTTTDIHGRFSLHTNNLPKKFTLMIASIGYRTQEILINKNNLTPLKIQLKENILELMGDVIIVSNPALARKRKK